MSRALLLLQRLQTVLELLQPDLVFGQTRLRARYNMLGSLFAETWLVQQAVGASDGLLRLFNPLDQPSSFARSDGDLTCSDFRANLPAAIASSPYQETCTGIQRRRAQPCIDHLSW